MKAAKFYVLEDGGFKSKKMVAFCEDGGMTKKMDKVLEMRTTA